MFALVDCNNFYASCERVFQPKLLGKPVAVLSNNDGCVIARSNEVKALGIEIGAPYFKIKHLIQQHGIAIFSSNYTLYGDMSARVMDTLREFTSEVEVYSIDEAFCDLSGFTHYNLDAYCHMLRCKVKQWTGIPVSIGVAKTKTLAKLANRIAKKADGVLVLDNPDFIHAVLARVDVGDVWGIGGQSTKLLNRHGVKTAFDFANLPDHWIRKNMSVVGLRTAHELRGIPCIPIEDAPKPKQSIIVSRSFGQPVTTLTGMLEAIISYTTRAGEELRDQGLVAKHIQVFLTTNRFNHDAPYANAITLEFPIATSYTPELIEYATNGIKRIYRQGFRYKKCGVMMMGLTSRHTPQFDMFETQNRDKQHSLMAALDTINARWGSNTLFYAGAGIKKPWAMKRDLKSPHYTTEWDDLLSVK
ncbi:MAG: Y-family DNA polymerase [Alphaproteobacteria bacterium]